MGKKFFCSDYGTRSSWIDHFLCSHSVDNLILTVQVLDQFIISDTISGKKCNC